MSPRCSPYAQLRARMRLVRLALPCCLAVALSGCDLCAIGLVDTFVLTFVDFPIAPDASCAECGLVSVRVDSNVPVLTWDTCSGLAERGPYQVFEVDCQGDRCEAVGRAISEGLRSRIELSFTSRSTSFEQVEPLEWLARERPADCTTDESFYYAATFTFPAGGGGR